MDQSDSSGAKVLLISEDDVERLLDLTELRAAMEVALRDLSAGRVTQPVRMLVPVTEHSGWFGLMPAIYRDVIGAKLVTVFPRNAGRGSHTHHAIIQLFQRETGEPVAVLGGRLITALRTAAVSAIATRELSDSNVRVLAILGSGVQARTHYQALTLVRNFDEVRVWSRTPEHAARFADEIGAKPTSAEAAVCGADVVVTVTNSSEPVLRGAWLKQGAHVNAIGAVGTNAREVDDEAMKNSAIVVESRESALRESGEIVQSGVGIYAELGELLDATKPKPQGLTTIYKSLGVAVEDVAAATLVYEKMRRERRCCQV
jgi:ornithine cyclodeaminase/alanine dehydrogenase-like protein (mu-crystallin family)